MEVVENDYVKFWFENGLLFNELKYPVHITAEVMAELIVMRHDFE